MPEEEKWSPALVKGGSHKADIVVPGDLTALFATVEVASAQVRKCARNRANQIKPLVDQV